MASLKAIVYKTATSLLRSFWRMRGERIIKVFNEDYKFAANTIFPHYRRFKLPRKGYLSEIVRYADYVQFHALVRYISEITGPVVVVDIGAHHGAYAVVLGKILQSRNGKVIAVEPNPDSFKILSENVRLNMLEETVYCEKVAVSDKAGSVSIDKQGTQSRIVSRGYENLYTVDSVTLEILLEEHAIGHVHLLLIDVEGAELPVLKGFPWNKVSVERIFCELHPYAWKDFGYNGIDMRKFLEDREYRCFDMYLKEYTTFDDEDYIGPAIFIPKLFS